MNIVQYGCQQVMIVKEMGTMDVWQRTIKDLTVMKKNVVNNVNETSLDFNYVRPCLDLVQL